MNDTWKKVLMLGGVAALPFAIPSLGAALGLGASEGGGLSAAGEAAVAGNRAAQGLGAAMADQGMTIGAPLTAAAAGDGAGHLTLSQALQLGAAGAQIGSALAPSGPQFVPAAPTPQGAVDLAALLAPFQYRGW